MHLDPRYRGLRSAVDPACHGYYEQRPVFS